MSKSTLTSRSKAANRISLVLHQMGATNVWITRSYGTTEVEARFANDDAGLVDTCASAACELAGVARTQTIDENFDGSLSVTIAIN